MPVSLSVIQQLLYQCHLSALSTFRPVAAGGQFRPEVSAPFCQRGISPDVQEADQAGEGQRGHEGGAGQVQVAVRRRKRLSHRGGGEDEGGRKDLDVCFIAVLYRSRKFFPILLCHCQIVINELISADKLVVSEQGHETRVGQVEITVWRIKNIMMEEVVDGLEL